MIQTRGEVHKETNLHGYGQGIGKPLGIVQNPVYGNISKFLAPLSLGLNSLHDTKYKFGSYPSLSLVNYIPLLIM